ncbi:MAG: SBBP repeat-containing protein [Ignavibacteria bacterium]
MTKYLQIFIILLLITKTNVVHSQVNQEWVARYGNTEIDAGSSMVTDDNGNVYVTGSDGVSTNDDIVTIKYSKSGTQQWIARYRGSGNGYDAGNSIKVDKENNVIIAGQSVGIGTGADYTTIKYNTSGVQQWVVRYSTAGNRRDAAYAVAIDNSNNIYVTGESENSIGGIDYLTIKYNSSGNQLWIAKYNQGQNSSNIAFDITCDIIGNVFVTGVSDGDFATVKYNSSGVQQWVSRFNGDINDNDEGKAIAVDALGNVYVSGSSVGTMFYYDYATVKYNSAGIQQWVRRYNGTSNFQDQLRAMVVDKMGNVYITGNGTETGEGYNFVTIKYNTLGDTLWIANYHNGPNDIAFAMAIDKYGSIYVTGESDGNGTGEDYATVKYDSSGIQQWVKRYDYSGVFGDYPASLAVDKNGSVYVTGQSNRDILTIKYSQLTGAITNLSEILTGYTLSQNYPNPFNPKTVIRYSIIENRFVNLRVYDVLGNEVRNLVSENKPAGNYEVEWNASNYPSGIYFYRLEIDGNIIDTKRTILLK